jgi:4-diphosphocytidyl-2-C-methyl-D-erythritol kinase
MRLLAPAKINLHLRVGGVQNDGFHPLMSWMVSVGLFDTLSIEDAPEGIALTCDDSSIPCDARNLVFRAAQLMLEESTENCATPRRSEAQPQGTHGEWIRGGAPLGRDENGRDETRNRGLKVHLSKRIPAGGGLGGGSSDAARMLLGLNRYLQLDLQVERLRQLAMKLGSDVPFFLFGPSSICTGRGEIVQPIAPPRPKWVVLILPDIAMPTPRVYQVFDSLQPGKVEAGLDQPPWEQWTSLDADELLPRLINDLEAPAFAIAPHLGQLRGDLEQSLGRIVRMSGSGSTLFTLFDDPELARAAVESIARRGIRSMAVELGVKPSDDV